MVETKLFQNPRKYIQLNKQGQNLINGCTKSISSEITRTKLRGR
jgi:hypothetical protein